MLGRDELNRIRRPNAVAKIRPCGRDIFVAVLVVDQQTGNLEVLSFSGAKLVPLVNAPPVD